MDGSAFKADLVLEAGGVKGIALVGAIVELSAAGYSFPRVAGTSAGAIVGTLVAAFQRVNRPLADLIDVMGQVDYARFTDDGLLRRATGVVGDAVAALVHGGSHSADYLERWLQPILTDLDVTTFGDLRLADPGGTLMPYQAYSLVVHSTDLTRRALVRLPWDYQRYGRDADTQRLVDAVRASMAIPLFFRPVQLKTAQGTVTWVDGGLVAGFPITVFDRTDAQPPRWETIGIRLFNEPSGGPDNPARTAWGIGVETLRTLIGNWNRYRYDDEGVNRRIIYIDTTSIDALDFALTRAQQVDLFNRGRQAAAEFLRVHPPQPPAVTP